jgi:hypothetical protein
MNAVCSHLDTSKWCGFLSGKAWQILKLVMESESSKVQSIMLVNTSGQWAIHCNQEILLNLNPLLRSLQIWIYDNLRNVSEPCLTKVNIIWMCLDACKLHSSTKWPIKPMSLNIHHFCNFLSITNLAWFSWVFLSRFHVNRCRTHWDIGNSSKTSQNKCFSICALGTANCCKKNTFDYPGRAEGILLSSIWPNLCRLKCGYTVCGFY